MSTISTFWKCVGKLCEFLLHILYRTSPVNVALWVHTESVFTDLTSVTSLYSRQYVGLYDVLLFV